MNKQVRRLVVTLAAACTFALGGCANLEAVRQFATSGSQLTHYTGLTQRYLTSAERRLQELPDEPFPKRDEVKAAIEENGRALAAQKESLIRLHEVTTGYMQALAKLAGADAYALGPQIFQVGGSITALQSELGITSQHAATYADLVSRVVDWALAAKQASDVKTFVRTHGPAMESMLEAMQNVVAGYEGVLRSEFVQLEGFQDFRTDVWSKSIASEASDPVMDRRRQLPLHLQRHAWRAIEREQNSTMQSVQAAKDGIAAVREGHTKMLANVDMLTSKEMVTLLDKVIADVQAARARLKAL